MLSSEIMWYFPSTILMVRGYDPLFFATIYDQYQVKRMNINKL